MVLQRERAQSSGFTMEPYCGSKNHFTNGLVYGEYGVGNNTGGFTCQPKGNGTSCSASGKGFTADLGVNPPIAGNAMGQMLYVDPTYTTASTAKPATGGGGGGVPEVLYPLLAASVLVLVVVLAYALARRVPRQRQNPA